MGMASYFSSLTLPLPAISSILPDISAVISYADDRYSIDEQGLFKENMGVPRYDKVNSFYLLCKLYILSCPCSFFILGYSAVRQGI